MAHGKKAIGFVDESDADSSYLEMESRIMDFLDSESVHPESANDHRHFALNKSRLASLRLTQNLNSNVGPSAISKKDSVACQGFKAGQLSLNSSSLLERRRKLASKIPPKLSLN